MAYFRVSPRVLGPLGAEQLQDPALSVLELVKNSWDADAKRVSIIIEQKKRPARIVVVDDGHGMTQDEFEQSWLVIGASPKRLARTSENGRPLIGEKGLGRLSSFALAKSVSIVSARSGKPPFSAKINWEQLLASESLEEYTVKISPTKSRRGTRVELQDLKAEWTEAQTNFLVTHAEFLASVPGEQFSINLRVNGKRRRVEDPISTVSRLAEASMDIEVLKDGSPRVSSCVVNGKDKSAVVFRPMKDEEKDAQLSGMRVNLKFFRRDEAAKRLDGVLERNEVADVLERYQGVRLYRDGINVPPYGLHQDDWASLEKQRTATGGPTLVPGNSQLIGEVHLHRKRHPQFVITAGRAGFSDQSAVRSAANYVRWAVRELGTARRAERLGIDSAIVPVRVAESKTTKTPSPEAEARTAIARVAELRVVRQDKNLRQTVEQANSAVRSVLDQNQEMLRLYAQLASMGIAATSFSHELRTEFDVVSEGIDQLKSNRRNVDAELVETIGDSWKRIRQFAALFKVVPIKSRRQSRLLNQRDIETSIEDVLGLAPKDKIKSLVNVPKIALAIVPAELDSILLNLVSNAVKAIFASKNRDAGRLRIDVSPTGSDASIRVADNGCGITSRVAEVMFEPLEGKFEEGTGMGLPITRYIAERYGGTATVSAKPPFGYETELVVTLKGISKPV